MNADQFRTIARTLLGRGSTADRVEAVSRALEALQRGGDFSLVAASERGQLAVTFVADEPAPLRRALAATLREIGTLRPFLVEVPAFGLRERVEAVDAEAAAVEAVEARDADAPEAIGEDSAVGALVWPEGEAGPPVRFAVWGDAEMVYRARPAGDLPRMLLRGDAAPTVERVRRCETCGDDVDADREHECAPRFVCVVEGGARLLVRAADAAQAAAAAVEQIDESREEDDEVGDDGLSVVTWPEGQPEAAAVYRVRAECTIDYVAELEGQNLGREALQ